MRDTWTLLTEDGSAAVNFTSFIGMQAYREGQALSNPIEQGSFASYNKTQEPLGLKLELGIGGDPSELEQALIALETFFKEPGKLIVVSPSYVYDNLTLETYDYRREINNGAGFLIVTLNLVEVREVATNLTTTVVTRPRNPTSANSVNNGKVMADDVETVPPLSWLNDYTDLRIPSGSFTGR